MTVVNMTHEIADIEDDVEADEALAQIAERAAQHAEKVRALIADLPEHNLAPGTITPGIGFTLIGRRAVDKHRRVQCWQPNVEAALISLERLTSDGVIGAQVIVGLVSGNADLPLEAGGVPTRIGATKATPST